MSHRVGCSCWQCIPAESIEPSAKKDIVVSLVPYVLMCATPMERWAFAQNIANRLSIPFDFVWEEIVQNADGRIA